MSYKDAILQPHKAPRSREARIPRKWTATTEHLTQQTGESKREPGHLQHHWQEHYKHDQGLTWFWDSV
eukprot:11955294-Ditylum_brightwellii.AAC.2